MRWKMVIAYDGTDYLGWQSQAGGRTVQDALEAQLKKVFKHEIRLHGASRTDSGVHARAQVAHFDAEWAHGAIKLKRALESGLGERIQIVRLAKTSDDFHARFSAKGKRYRYTIILGSASPFDARWAWSVDYAIDKKLLNAALAKFVGRHNFSAFAGGLKKGEDPIKAVTKARAKWVGKNKIVIDVEGSGFLYKMVRSMVGAAVEVGRGRIALSRIRELLKKPQRTHEVVTAPAQGLCLEKVFY